MDRGVSRDHISVMGRDFQSNTRITGFITKKDVILGGLRTGAIFGSLFDSLLSLLTGVGVLFVSFIGTVVAAGPLSSVLLGAAKRIKIQGSRATKLRVIMPESAITSLQVHFRDTRCLY